MSQESTKEPAVGLEVGCVKVAAVYIEKEPEKTAASKLAPIFSGFFFGVLRTLAEHCSADCRCADLCVWRVPPRAMLANCATYA